MAEAQRAYFLITLATLVVTALGQSCTPRQWTRGAFVQQLVFPGDTAEANSLPPRSCDYWTVTASQIANEDTCVAQGDGPAYLLFEFWRLNNSNGIDTRLLEDTYFLVARGAQPNVTYVGTSVQYVPSLALYPQLGQNGTLQDADADKYYRPYHRIVVPVNASSSRLGSGDWYVTVANMDTPSGGYSVLRYDIHVSCVNATAAPCPRPTPGAGECGGQGSCVDPPQGVSLPGLNRVCSCAAGLGDYGCQTPAPALSDGDVVSAVLQPGAWAYWQLSVPQPSSGLSRPTLLVELSRSTVGFGPALGGFGGSSSSPSSSFPYGGDPVLIVMPKDADGSNRVPWFTDVTTYADLRSYFLQQELHYVLSRNTSAGLAAGGGSGSAYYIAVYNNDQRFTGSSALLYPTANVTLRVRWRTTSASSDPPLCPNDCFGQGSCSDPWEAGGLSSSGLPAVATNAAKPADFQCDCLSSDIGGTLCEGRLRNVSVSSVADGGTGSLTPGQWAWYVLNFDPRRFSFSSDSVAIQWAVYDDSGAPGSAFVNAFLTLDENSFPRNAQLDSDDPFRRGLQVFYSALAARSSPPAPLQVKGSDLREGYAYVLGVYNSDYVRKATFRYSLATYVPVSSGTWLHPYMSVVLGVTASIILCLFMTLCRRLVQRYGWGPFRSRDPMVGQGAGGVPRIQVTQHQRPQGVPSNVIEGFRTYEYTASKAEKAQLALSRRDHTAALQQSASSNGRASMGNQLTGNGNLTPTASLRLQGSAQVQQGQASEGAAAGVEAAGAAAAAPAAAVGHVCTHDGCCAAGHIAHAQAAPAAPTAAAVVVVPAGTEATSGSDALTPAAGASGAAPSGAGGAGAGAGAGGNSGDDDEPQCTVCLCEYEEGERITQLPCRHEFHSTCINKWLQTHSTCPICRISLLPEQPAEGSGSESGSGPGSGAQPEGAPAPPPADGTQPPQPQPPAAYPPILPAAHGAHAGAVMPVPAMVPMQPYAAFGEAPVAAPPPPAAAAQAAGSAPAAAAPQTGVVARVLGSMRRATHAGAGAGSNQLMEMGDMSAQLRERERAATAGGVAEGVVQPGAAPAELLAAAYNGGTNAHAGSMQILAQGPSATLEARGAASGGGAAAASGSPRSARLAAGRLSSPPRSPLPLGAVAGAPGGVGGPAFQPGAVPPLRDELLLEQRMDVEAPEPPGLSPSGHR